MGPYTPTNIQPQTNIDTAKCGVGRLVSAQIGNSLKLCQLGGR